MNDLNDDPELKRILIFLLILGVLLIAVPPLIDICI